MKRIFGFVLSLVFLLTLTPAALAVPPEEAEVSPVETIEITSSVDFLKFAEKCSRDIYSRNVIFSLTADIDLSGSSFAGVPYFAGTFLGNGHRVLGVNLSGDGSRQGLFRRVAEGAVIRDLHVNGTITPGGTREYIGGLTGINAGQLIQCSFTGTVSGLSTIGGIAGLNEAAGLIDGCSFAGSVSGEHQCGGIVGENRGVISRCDNSGTVNTEAIVPQSEAHFDLAILSEDDFLDLANIGGIAGNNDGIISICKNTGAVGYKNTAYNVGGIAGKSSGYVEGCINAATVNGRRDVGGICGQLIPSVRWDFTNDKLEALSGQLGSLNYLIHKASQHATDNTSELAGELARMNGYTSSAISELEQLMRSYESNDQHIIDSFHLDPATGEVTIDPIDLSGLNTSGLTSALSDLNAEASVLSGILHGSFDELTEDMAKIVQQMSSVLGSMFSLLNSSGDTGLYEQRDLSAEESYDHDIGAVADCFNYGEIHAENNAGGIIGTIGFEVSFDMEDSLNASKFLTSDASQLLFAVVRDCKSYSEIQTKNDHAGCVIGAMDMGAVIACVGIGSAESQSGDYVGGIAGESQGTIRGCWSRSVLRGGKYVGGVAGLGKDIDACRCWTHVDAASEYAGAVAGWSDGIIAGNLYVDASPAGIDGVSFSGMTDPVSESELLDDKELPENFNDLVVRFVAEGETISTISVPFGGSVEELPAVENDGDRYWKWDEFNREHIYHSLVVEGKYYAPGTTLSSGEEVPLFLVEGVFYEGQSLTVAQYPFDETEDVLAAYTLFVDGYDGQLTVHMLNENKGRLYLVDSNGDHIAASYKNDGKYIVFQIDNGASFLLTELPQAINQTNLGIAAATILTALFLILFFLRRKKKRATSKAEETSS